jgi:hypothetical protein
VTLSKAINIEIIIVAAAWLLALSAMAAEPSEQELRSGIYEIDVETLMPHLEENLRYANTRECRCVRDGEESSIFPILKHKSLAGCRLDGATRRDDATVFRLNCHNPTVATGTARLQTRASVIVGELNVTMGGKNMTFSQRIQARWRGDCGIRKK